MSPDHLGEADHVHVDARALGLHQHVAALDEIAHAAFERARHFDWVNESAGGVLLEHDRRHQRPGEIVGDQPAADSGLEDVLAHLGQRLGGRDELRVDHVAGLDAVFDHLHVAHVGREQRLHAAAVDAVHDQHFVGRLLQRVEEARA